MRSSLYRRAEYIEIGQLLAEGKTIVEMARMLQISQRKVTKLISEMKDWTSSANHAQIVAVMFRKGMLR